MYIELTEKDLELIRHYQEILSDEESTLSQINYRSMSIARAIAASVNGAVRAKEYQDKNNHLEH